jgi:L,D-transpeptidase catalytic domain
MKRSPLLQRTKRWATLLALLLVAGLVTSTSPQSSVANAAKKSTPVTTKAKKSAKGVVPKALSKAPTASARSGKAAAVEGWSVANPLIGWDRYTDDNWPVSGEAIIAVAVGDSVVVRRRPGNGEPGLRIGTGTSVTGKVTLLITRRYLDWIEVLLPARPNGTIGWVEVDQVDVLSVPYRVVVDKNSHTMFVEKDGKPLLSLPIAVGTGNTPTPSGLFFVREVVKEDPNGPYGPYVLGLSGYSEVLNSFAGGEGAIGIHGTNQPGLIGSDASFGCVRLTNENMSKLVLVLPLGTPVEITDSLSALPTQRRSYGIPDLVYLDTPIPEPTPESEGISILDGPAYNAAAIDFFEPS